MPAENKRKSPENRFSVDVSPDVSALKMFKSMSFTPWYALGEFVDNSITSAQRDVERLKKVYGLDYRLVVEIDIDATSGTITISDNAGGIAKSEMQRALRTGQPPKDTSRGLSKHGVGLKAAAFWWGSKVEIETWPIAEDNGWRLDVDISEKITPIVSVDPIQKTRKSGTRIVIHNLWQKVPQTSTIRKIESYLPSIYRMFIAERYTEVQLKCTIRYCGKDLEYTPAELLVAPYWPDANGPEKDAANKYWRLPITVNLQSGKVINGWVGILESLSRDQSGFFLHYRGKGISGVVPQDDGRNDGDASGSAAGAYKPKVIFGQGGSYPDQSYVGEFDISSFGKTITTDAPLWSIDEEFEFVSAVDKILQTPPESFAKMVLNFKRRKASRKDIEKQQAWDQRESQRLQEALDLVPSHTVVLPVDQNDHAPSISAEDGKISFTIRDKEGHTHSFQLQWVVGRTEPFLKVVEDSLARVHNVYANREHAALDDIQYTADVRNVLQRICVALAAAEVFVPGHERQQIRLKLNELLGELHGQG
jgi:hypothetical protein